LLDDAATADHLIGRLSACDPRLRPFLLVYREAKTPEAKRFAAVFTILNFPGLRPFVATNLARTTDLDKIDNYRRNWWCDAGSESHAEVNAPGFFSAAMNAEAAKQQAVLRESASAANYLSLQSVAWAKANPTDPRSPEALALSIRATRYGCSAGGATGAASKAAFDLLHSQYPNSKWAKEYPYWFKD
jgi:hypothetical protein